MRQAAQMASYARLHVMGCSPSGMLCISACTSHGMNNSKKARSQLQGCAEQLRRA